MVLTACLTFSELAGINELVNYALKDKKGYNTRLTFSDNHIRW